MNRDISAYFAYRFIMVAFYTLLIATMFMPLISFDKYVEYSFNDPTYSTKYNSSTMPISSKIKPYDLIYSLSVDEDEVELIRRQYEKVKNTYYNQYSNGEITYAQYTEQLAADSTTANYYINIIAKGSDEFNRIQDKVVLISIITLVLYCVIAVIWLIAIVNLFVNNKVLYTLNAQASWIIGIMTLAYIIYIFATSVTNNLSLEYVNEEYQVTETTMKCFAPNTGFILIFLLFVAYIPFSLIISNKFNKAINYVEEVPDFISTQLIIEQKRKKLQYNSQQASQTMRTNTNKKKRKKKKKGQHKKR